MATIDDFKKIEMKMGKILSAEAIDGSDKLLKLSVDFAEERPRQVISGIAKFFPDTGELVGKICAFVTNLEKRSIMGMESEAMILASSVDDKVALFETDGRMPLGTLVK